MLANILSILRVALLPAVLYGLWTDGPSTLSWTTIMLLGLAVATDMADGFVARRFGQPSRTGQIVDPLADKIFLGGLGVALVWWREFPYWLLLMLVSRDVIIVLCGFILLRTRRVVIPANMYGKITTFFASCAVLAFILPAPPPLRQLFIYSTALFIVVSSISYVVILIGVVRVKID
ncbi:MAG: hypothetical protein GKR89_08245 [Candidatus Latescibacteria bacterium]|nr:hypothetical protein [Candidatus Latescibacterota bacterium]